MTHDIDLLIAGAGPVGLAAAIEARMLGLTVMIIEPRSEPIDKACGEGLMPGAVRALARLGIVPQGHPLQGVRYCGSGRRVEHLFSHGGGLGVRRTVLSSALSARAVDVGVQRIDARVDSLQQDASGVSAVGVRACYLLGADGLHSTVRRLVGLERPGAARRRRFGFRRHFAVEPWTDLIEVHWAGDFEAYVTPVSPASIVSPVGFVSSEGTNSSLSAPGLGSSSGVVGVAILGPQGTDFDRALAAVPELAERLAGAARLSSLRGAGPFLQRAVGHSRGRVLLVGDASGYVDAITGEGIRVGMAQASAAVACIAADDLSPYGREWARRTRDFRLLTGGLAVTAASPLRSVVVPAAARFPRVFGAIVDRLAR